MNPHQYISNRLQPLLDGVLRDFASQASEMYQEATDYTMSKYNTQIARNALPYNRHWLANERLHDLATNYDDIKLEVVGNGKNSFYTILQQNNVVITASQVSTRSEIVRYSRYRNRLAELFGVNPTLFQPEPVQPTITNDKMLYGIILHGPISSKDHNIGFVNMAFPDEYFRRYPYNECLFKLCGLKHPYKVLEEPVTGKQHAQPVELKKKNQGK